MLSLSLSKNEFHSYYKNYIDLVEDSDIVNGLISSFKRTEAFFQTIPSEKLEFQYAPGKWTIKEIIQHLIDAEIVFAYRALRFAREDKTALPGFDENHYAKTSHANNYSIDKLIKHYGAVRQATIHLFESFSPETLLKTGNASGSEMSIRALGYVIIGHETHHSKVIRERYL